MIYCCFPFFNELDLLEIRLRELAGIVDRFVLVEGTKTFSGHDKPLHYATNRQRFREWWPVISHLVCTDQPASGDSWGREIHQRNHLGYGLLGCKPDDLILITDGDEIVSANAMLMLRPNPGEILNLDLNRYFYWLNCRATGDPGCIAKLMHYETMCAMGGPEKAARAPHFTQFPVICGWHFSHLGGVEGIQAKLSAFSHQEYNQPPWNDPDRLTKVLQENTDLFCRGTTIAQVSLDELPICVRQYKSRFKHLLWEKQ